MFAKLDELAIIFYLPKIFYFNLLLRWKSNIPINSVSSDAFKSVPQSWFILWNIFKWFWHHSIKQMHWYFLYKGKSSAFWPKILYFNLILKWKSNIPINSVSSDAFKSVPQSWFILWNIFKWFWRHSIKQMRWYFLYKGKSSSFWPKILDFSLILKWKSNIPINSVSSDEFDNLPQFWFLLWNILKQFFDHRIKQID